MKLKFEKRTNPTKKMEIHNPLTSNQCHTQLEIWNLLKNTASNKTKKNGAYSTLIKSRMVNKPRQTPIYSTHLTMSCFTMQVTHQLKERTVYVVLPGSPWNWNALRRPLVVQLCVARYRELYPLLTYLPGGVLVWGCVCFFLCISVTSCLCCFAIVPTC